MVTAVHLKQALADVDFCPPLREAGMDNVSFTHALNTLIQSAIVTPGVSTSCWL